MGTAANPDIPYAPVAIIMRTKERPLLLRRALLDVTQQSYQGWHLVIINDGGTAATVDRLVAELSPSLAGRVSVLHNEESQGAEATSNRAIRSSSSAYISIHDDDDTWHPEFLELTVSHLEGQPDAGVAVRTEIVWEQISGDSVTELGREIFGEEIHEFTLFEMIKHNRAVPISMLYRRSVHDEIGYYREDIRGVGDWEFNLRLASSHQVGFIGGPPLAFWRQRPNQQGLLGNSVIAAAEDHRKFDLLVRNEALQAHVQQQGLGGVLYLTKYIDRRHDEMVGLLREQSDRIRLLEEAISDASLVSLLRRRYRRLKGKILDPHRSATSETTTR